MDASGLRLSLFAENRRLCIEGSGREGVITESGMGMYDGPLLVRQKLVFISYHDPLPTNSKEAPSPKYLEVLMCRAIKRFYCTKRSTVWHSWYSTSNSTRSPVK